MKNLKDIILEKLKVTKHDTPELDIDDVDTVIEFLTGDDTARRQLAIDAIREEVINYGCERMTVTNKIKSSESYFIQFSKIYLRSEKPDSLMLLRKYKYDDYYTIIINADDNVYNKIIVTYLEPWKRTQPNLSPKTAEIYQIPPDCPVYQICKILDSNKF